MAVCSYKLKNTRALTKYLSWLFFVSGILVATPLLDYKYTIKWISLRLDIKSFVSSLLHWTRWLTKPESYHSSSPIKQRQCNQQAARVNILYLFNNRTHNYNLQKLDLCIWLSSTTHRRRASFGLVLNRYTICGGITVARWPMGTPQKMQGFPVELEGTA